jgi:hypothetical protein
MVKRDNVTAILAIIGTILLWFPILTPVLLSLAFFARAGVFRLDYLMPAELFPAVVIGGAALLWAALRVHLRWRLIAWGVGIAIGLLVGGQVLAVATGLASGDAEPTGWRLGLVLASLAVYSLSVAATGVGGLLLLRDLYKPLGSPTERQ